MLFRSLLNSKLSTFFVRHHSPRFSGGFYKFTAPYLGQLPIPSLAESHPLRRQLFQLATEKLDIARQSQQARKAEARYGTLEKKIDKVVYELYDLTPAERKLVEESLPD